MKELKNILLLVFVILLVFSMYAFAAHRYEKRVLKDVTIAFTDYREPLISENNVNKLLIQNDDSLKNLFIENLDLKESEARLEENPMIRDAEVSVTLDGLLEVVVEQRQPVARIIGKMNAYLDEDNSIMPLSEEHTAHVPVVFGFRESVQHKTFELISFLRADELLKNSITQIEFDGREEVTMGVRAYDFRIKLGQVEHLEHKMMNYKAFMAKMIKDKRLDQIESVDLRFDNQVVVTKK